MAGEKKTGLEVAENGKEDELPTRSGITPRAVPLRSFSITSSKFTLRRKNQYTLSAADGDKEMDLADTEQVIRGTEPHNDVTNHEQLCLVNSTKAKHANGANGDVKPLDDHEVIGHSHNKIAPVAWMIIVGDGLHNFIDGLAIGAAFTESTLAGISISLAVICEEFPHELGDFAVLLKSGMKVKKAVLFNFLSALLCYGGLGIGIALGELAAASRWIFAVAGGMFLYISLVDMMPEMNAAQENGEKVVGKKMAFLIQNLGLLSGFGIMVVLALFGGEIDFQ